MTVICMFCLDAFDDHESMSEHYEKVNHYSDKKLALRCGHCGEQHTIDEPFVELVSGVTFYSEPGFMTIQTEEAPEKDTAYQEITKEDARKAFGICIHNKCFPEYLKENIEIMNKAEHGEDMVFSGP